MKSKLNKIRELLADLNRDEIAALQQELTDIAPFAKEASPEEKLLAPGHYFEDRLSVRGNSSQQYLYERWYERDGLSLKHKGRLLYKGSLQEYVASLDKIE
ncbi:MAG: hypothetical protein IPL32_19570 [Chloracidobacterium sp.]|nr:hypothetical protein [Chloracidobacterium sp.]